jgi:hypothetical protein
VPPSTSTASAPPSAPAVDHMALVSDQFVPPLAPAVDHMALGSFSPAAIYINSTLLATSLHRAAGLGPGMGLSPMVGYFPGYPGCPLHMMGYASPPMAPSAAPAVPYGSTSTLPYGSTPTPDAASHPARVPRVPTRTATCCHYCLVDHDSTDKREPSVLACTSCPPSSQPSAHGIC